ncbi:MAG: 30S ribosomal protein S7 [Gemmatimonadetes bacterium]|nr:MAG: 30S ribosomal protein S7 [Gemmatimonadota bacterium]
MSRKRAAEKRQLLPDPKYHDVMVTRFINNVTKRGKKSVAERSFYAALDLIEARTGQQGLAVFKKAIDNVKPIVEVRSRRIGGSTYQVPTEVRPDRQISLAIRWLITYSNARSERTLAERLAGEFIAASKGEGASIKKREDTHRMAEANKAFSHYRW